MWLALCVKFSTHLTLDQTAAVTEYTCKQVLGCVSHNESFKAPADEYLEPARCLQVLVQSNTDTVASSSS